MAKQQIEYPLDQSKEIFSFLIPDTLGCMNRYMFYGKIEVLAINWTFDKNTRAKFEFSEEFSAFAWCHSGR